MKRRLVLGLAALVALGVILAGCTWFGTESLLGPQSLEVEAEYILAFNRLPAKLEQTIADMGGSIRTVLEEIDAVVVTGSADFVAAAEGMRGLDAIIPDVKADWLPDVERVDLSSEHIGLDEPRFSNRQWDMQVIDAPGAWDAGYTGDGVRVAIMDTGIDPNHPDLAPNLNVGLSKSYVPYEPFIDDLDGHGCNVAGIVAAADNELGVIGVAPNAELVAIKVLDGGGGGYFSWLLEGLLYATTIDVDIVNMSLGTYLSHDGYVGYGPGAVYVGASAINGFVKVVRKTLDYVAQQGILAVASAGNGALDGTGDSGLMHIPSDVGGCLVVSATGPIDAYDCLNGCDPLNPNDWVLDPTADFDVFALYSDYGPQVDFAAPGGNISAAAYPFPWAMHFVYNCYKLGGYAWFAGTSQAAPHVAGVAALIVEKNGGDMKPAHITRELRLSADDLGKPGQDPYFGYGRVNAANAVAP